MVAPKKMIMGRGESAVSIGRARSIARKPVVKVKPKPKSLTDKATKRGLKAANAKVSKNNRKTPQYEIEIQGKIYKGVEAERKMASLRKLQG